MTDQQRIAEMVFTTLLTSRDPRTIATSTMVDDLTSLSYLIAQRFLDAAKKQPPVKESQ